MARRHAGLQRRDLSIGAVGCVTDADQLHEGQERGRFGAVSSIRINALVLADSHRSVLGRGSDIAPLALAIGLSIHWPVIGWSHERTAIYTAHALVRAVVVFAIWIVLPDQRYTTLPLAVAIVLTSSFSSRLRGCHIKIMRFDTVMLRERRDTIKHRT